MVKPVAAVLPLPLSVMCWPMLPLVLEGEICTNMPEAAVTALKALSMPAPQVAVEHTHSRFWLVSVYRPVLGSVVVAASWQAVEVVEEEPGKGSTLDCMRAISCAGVIPGAAASISAATPEAMGAEKLVPTLPSLSELPPLLR